MNIAQGNNKILRIGNCNAVLNSTLFCPPNYNDGNTMYNTNNKDASNIYNITPDMVISLSLQNNISNKLTYCYIKLQIPTDNNSVFKYIYSNNYIYLLLTLYTSTDNNIKTDDELINSSDSINYTEEFFVNSKQLLNVTNTYEVYEFTLISSKWWNFHKNIHYSTKGKKESIATILKNTYALANLTFELQDDYANNGQLENTYIEYSTSANDNLLSIEKFIKHKLCNLNFTSKININILDIYNCIIAYNKLTGKYFSWIKLPESIATNLNDLQKLPNYQKDIPEYAVAINNSILTTDNQAVLSTKRFILMTKDIQYTKQKQLVYQTYNYDTDNIVYDILSQQNKQKVLLNDNAINIKDLTDNIMYPYNYSLDEIKQLNNNYIEVIPEQMNSMFNTYASISEDSSNIADDVESINFNINNILIYALPQIKYNVGHIIFLRFVNDLTDNLEDTNSYSMYNGYYIIKSTNLILSYNQADSQIITLSKLY